MMEAKMHYKRAIFECSTIDAYFWKVFQCRAYIQHNSQQSQRWKTDSKLTSMYSNMETIGYLRGVLVCRPDQCPCKNRSNWKHGKRRRKNTDKPKRVQFLATVDSMMITVLDDFDHCQMNRHSYNRDAECSNKYWRNQVKSWKRWWGKTKQTISWLL